MSAITAASESKALKLANLLETVFKASSRAHEAAWELRRQHAEIERLRAENESLKQQLVQPIDMVLHCPKCGMQHIDGPEAGKQIWGSNFESPVVEVGGWTNPPHRSHLCHGCGHIWRPADVPTNGVQAVKTKGRNDSPAVQLAQRVPDGSVVVKAKTTWGIIGSTGHARKRHVNALRAALSAAPRRGNAQDDSSRDEALHPPAASKPMTDEQARELCKEIHGPGYMPSDLKTVRATERFHKIKE